MNEKQDRTNHDPDFATPTFAESPEEGSRLQWMAKKGLDPRTSLMYLPKWQRYPDKDQLLEVFGFIPPQKKIGGSPKEWLVEVVFIQTNSRFRLLFNCLDHPQKDPVAKRTGFHCFGVPLASFFVSEVGWFYFHCLFYDCF